MSEDQLRVLGERYYTTDLNGNRVLYGLTLEETSEYEGLLRADLHHEGQTTYSTAEELTAARARRIELRRKIECAWTEVIGALARIATIVR
jgi:hypothetical protein